MYGSDPVSVSVLVQSFVSPRIRAICFSYCFGTEEELQAAVAEAVQSYGTPPEGKHGYIYGEAERILKALHEACLPLPSYMRLVPVRYSQAGILGNLSITQYSYPWGDSLDASVYFQRITGQLERNIRLIAPGPERDARMAIDTAANALCKLKEPYGEEREVRLFVYSPEFPADADRSCWERFSHPVEIPKGAIVTSLDTGSP